MTPEANDALIRLKAAVEGKPSIHAWEGRTLRAKAVEVNPRDVIDLTSVLPRHVKTQSLQSGSLNAVELIPDVRTVSVYVVDVLHLIREAERTIAAPAATATAPLPAIQSPALPPIAGTAIPQSATPDPGNQS